MVGILSQGTTIKEFLKKSSFLNYQLLEISCLVEEILIDKFKLSSRELRSLVYEIYILSENKHKFIKNKFAAILKAEIFHILPSYRKNFYLICLNKNKIFQRNNPFLKELLFYILTHELVHLVRFVRYESDFYALNKWEEEKTVHKITRNILKNFKILFPYIEKVLDYFDKIYL